MHIACVRNSLDMNVEHIMIHMWNKSLKESSPEYSMTIGKDTPEVYEEKISVSIFGSIPKLKKLITSLCPDSKCNQ